jgi:hypothetical protein
MPCAGTHDPSITLRKRARSRLSCLKRKATSAGLATHGCPPLGCETAYEPVRLDRVGKPRLCPTCGHAGAHCSLVHAAPVGQEQGELSPRLMEAAGKPGTLRHTRTAHGRRRPRTALAGRSRSACGRLAAPLGITRHDLASPCPDSANSCSPQRIVSLACGVRQVREKSVQSLRPAAGRTSPDTHVPGALAGTAEPCMA